MKIDLIRKKELLVYIAFSNCFSSIVFGGWQIGSIAITVSFDLEEGRYFLSRTVVICIVQIACKVSRSGSQCTKIEAYELNNLIQMQTCLKKLLLLNLVYSKPE